MKLFKSYSARLLALGAVLLTGSVSGLTVMLISASRVKSSLFLGNASVYDVFDVSQTEAMFWSFVVLTAVGLALVILQIKRKLGKQSLRGCLANMFLAAGRKLSNSASEKDD
ncbi:MAG: hypothetical protein LBO63_07580 [Oscillospiraceae bacterium]|nr:hypothetical protein [Oscillospiraceae bacterium]